MNSALHSPPVVIFFSIVAISLVVASIDFLRRRVRANALAEAKPSELKKFFAKENVEQPSQQTVEQPVVPVLKASIEKTVLEVPAKPVVEKPAKRATKTPTPIERLTELHTVDRGATPTLAVASIVPLPMPAPRVPTSPKRINVQISWWQEA